MPALVFNSTDLSGGTYDLDVLEGFQVPFMSVAGLQTDGLAAASKVISYRGESRALELAFPCKCEGTNIADLVGNINRIMGVLSAPTADVTIGFTTVSPYNWYGQWDGVLKPVFISPTCARFELRFMCQPYQVVASTTTIVGTGDGGAILMPETSSPPDPLIDIIIGDGDIPAIYTLRNIGAEVAAGNLVITNNGNTITYADIFPAGYYVRFDTENRECYVSSNGTDWTEVYGKVTGSAYWIPLNGGVQNSITVAGVTGVTLTITYTGRYS